MTVVRTEKKKIYLRLFVSFLYYNNNGVLNIEQQKHADMFSFNFSYFFFFLVCQERKIYRATYTKKNVILFRKICVIYTIPIYLCEKLSYGKIVVTLPNNCHSYLI